MNLASFQQRFCLDKVHLLLFFFTNNELVWIAEELTKNKRVSHLILEGLCGTIIDSFLFDALSVNAAITKLTLRDTVINGRDFATLLKRNTTIVSLELSRNSSDLFSLILNALEMNTAITELSLAHQQLGAQDIIELLRCNSTITHLTIENDDILNDIAIAFRENRTLTRLNILCSTASDFTSFIQALKTNVFLTSVGNQTMPHEMIFFLQRNLKGKMNAARSILSLLMIHKRKKNQALKLIPRELMLQIAQEMWKEKREAWVFSKKNGRYNDIDFPHCIDALIIEDYFERTHNRRGKMGNK